MVQQQQNMTTSNPRRQFDTVSKVVVRGNLKDWAAFGLGTSNVVVIGAFETEQSIVRSNRADSFIHVKVNGKEVVVHLEMQTHDSRETPMPYRMAGYAGRAIESFQLPVYSHVIYLHPRAGRNDPGEYFQGDGDYEIRVKYKVIRLCELEGSPFLEAGVKGLIPFTPLMKPPAGVGDETWLQRCFEAANAVYEDPVSKADYLTDVAILSGLVFDYETIRDILMEATMYESSVIQHFLQQGIEQGVQQGIEQGTRASLIEGILENLEVRFHAPNLGTVASVLADIEDMERLKALRRESVQTSSLLAFQRVLGLTVETNGNASL